MNITHQLGIKRRLQRIENKIGNTPLFKISHLFKEQTVSIYAKLEWYQLGESIKARPAFNIIRDAVLLGQLGQGQRLIDATTGNMGIAYATIARALSIPVTLCLPEDTDEERKRLLTKLGAQLILTSKFEGIDGAREMAKSLAKLSPDQYHFANQYGNAANWKAHYNHIANEIWKQTRGEITHFVAGMGTTGTLVGTSKKLKELNPKIEAVGLQVNDLTKSIEGWKSLTQSNVPRIYEAKVVDQILRIDSSDAYDLIKQIVLKEGLWVSPSAAANLLGAINLAKELKQGTIVTTFADNSEKYGAVIKELF